MTNGAFEMEGECLPNQPVKFTSQEHVEEVLRDQVVGTASRGGGVLGGWCAVYDQLGGM